MSKLPGILSRFFLCLLMVVSILSAKTVTIHAGQEIVVSAASSLTNVFTELGERFEAENPGVRILFNFASSGSLMRQIEMGAPVDLFASADSFTMDQAVSKGLVIGGTRTDFARNSLVLITPASSATTIRNLVDLTGPKVERIALGNPETVPAGRYVREMLEDKGLWKALSAKYIYANSVRQVLDYVRRGEVDAGFVYRTDALPAGGKVQVVMNMGSRIRVRYPMAVVSWCKETGLAARLINYITSEQGRAILVRYGFQSPG